ALLALISDRPPPIFRSTSRLSLSRRSTMRCRKCSATMITISREILSARSNVGPTHHPIDLCCGAMAAPSASIAAQNDLPQRRPHASTRRGADERCTASWPGWGRYPRSANRMFLLSLPDGFETEALAGESVGIGLNSRRQHPPLVFALDDLFDAHGRPLGWL